MCFSAPGSFAIGTALVASSAYTVKKASEKNRGYIAFSFFPFVFGLQQILEGFVWLGILDGQPVLVRMFSLLFTFFALGFWPFFVPFSMLMIERNIWSDYRKLLLGMTVAGVIVGLYSYVPILLGINPMTIRVVHHSISYDTPVLPFLKDLNAAIYLFLVITPFFTMPDRRFKLFGALLLVSAVIASHFYFSNFVSVWCFFAAVLSIYIAYMLHDLRPNCPPEKSHQII